MVETSTTKEIATNAAVRRVAIEAEVVEFLSSERVIKKLAEMLSNLFLKCIIKI